MTRHPRIVVFLASLLLAGPSAGQETGDRVTGKAFALSFCAECHFVADEQVGMPSFDAPPFAEVAAEPSITELSLRVFLRTPHNRMPDILLTRTQTDDVIAYILSLRRNR